MYQPNKNKLAVFFILVTALAANSMTIPLVNGNTWSYSYRNDTTVPGTNTSEHIAEGKLNFSVDSVKAVADTTFFSLSYFDSGALYHGDTVHQFVKTYRIKYLLFHDTVRAIDSIFSPGYNQLLLSFIVTRDTAYSWGTVAAGGDEEQKTATYAINFMGMQMTLFRSDFKYSHISLNPNPHVGSVGGNKKTSIGWIPDIGMTFCASNNFRSEYFHDSSDSITYTLLSFNNTPVPSFSQLSVKSITPYRTASNSTGLYRKSVILAGKNLKNDNLPLNQNGCFSLRGQKMGTSYKSQMIIYR
jgi:hypothetical protein